MDEHAEDTVKRWERHISTFVGGASLLVLSLIWSGYSSLSNKTVAMAQDIAVIKVRLSTSLDVQERLSQVERVQMRDGSHIESLTIRVGRIERTQAEEDERERKEHGGFK